MCTADSQAFQVCFFLIPMLLGGREFVGLGQERAQSSFSNNDDLLLVEEVSTVMYDIFGWKPI